MLVGGVPSPDVRVVSNSLILAVTPPGTPGPARVVVRTRSPSSVGDQDTVWSAWFLYELPTTTFQDVRFLGPIVHDLEYHPLRGDWPHPLRPTDIDRDGKLDFLVPGSKLVLNWGVSLEQYKQAVLPPPTYSVTDPGRLWVGDVCGSSLPDLLWQLGHDCFVAEQTAPRRFGPWTKLEVTTPEYGFEFLSLVDLDGDGRSEIIGRDWGASIGPA